MEPKGSLLHLQATANYPHLSQMNPVHATPTLPNTSLRSFLTLSSHLCLGLPSGLLPSGFPTKTPLSA